MDRVIVKPYGKDKFEVAKDFKCYGYRVPAGFVTNGRSPSHLKKKYFNILIF